MKIKTLSGKPADFSLTVKIHELDGTEDEFQFIAIGRTMLDWQPVQLARIEHEMNALLERKQALEAEEAKTAESAQAPQTGKSKKTPKPKRLTVPHDEIAKATEEGLNKAVAKVREFASGWELEDEFTDENIKRLIVRFPGIQDQGWNKYDERIKGNRLGN